MAFENLIPHISEIKQMQAQGLTLFQIVDKLKASHDVSTSTGTLSRFFKTKAVKEELFGENQPIVAHSIKSTQQARQSSVDTSWIAEFKQRDEKTREVISQLASELRLLNETIHDSSFEPMARAKRKGQLFLTGVGVGCFLATAIAIIAVAIMTFK